MSVRGLVGPLALLSFHADKTDHIKEKSQGWGGKLGSVVWNCVDKLLPVLVLL